MGLCFLRLIVVLFGVICGISKSFGSDYTMSMHVDYKQAMHNIGVGSRGARGAVAPIDFWFDSVTESRSRVK